MYNQFNKFKKYLNTPSKAMKDTPIKTNSSKESEQLLKNYQKEWKIKLKTLKKKAILLKCENCQEYSVVINHD